VRALVLACLMLAGCTITLTATEKGAAIGLTLDPTSVLTTILNDDHEKEKRP